ncbi:ABC transporter substrate-binding protein [[Mycobacterium] kokjensenii]|uniref:ABC transporter substrate-binding protein n=1 Tax=[Mycobacterium] kokjensenii TaxID=3064287 RepID=A0ABN9N2W6_9MYCO|nr:ABC transporter substrate-binding protein [Mycolicibacter sp. MU0083]CAJ1499592.1 ABC transporter substrate-binding protein [Mycolicibacter sp. MU0083]
MAARWRQAGAWVVAIVTGLGAWSMSACTSATVDEIDYAVDGSLPTYNSTTVAGAASAGPQAFSRTLLGFGYHGPDGQIVTDHDFGSISVVGRAPLVLDYQIDDAAVYSDGKPVTCDDLVLAWAAQSGRFPGFDAASRAGYLDIENIECESGAKKARVSFFPDRNIVDYEELFTATSMMPSHIISDMLGINITEAVQGKLGPAEEAIARIAQAWNTTWQLDRDADLRRFPSSGPYKIDSVLDGGAVVLVANDLWWGAKPVTNRITVWPQATDIAERVNKRVVEVIDVATGSAGSLITPDDYQSADSPSGGIEQLIFAPSGPLSETPARRAVALCTPRDVIARDAGVAVVNSRLNTAIDDAFDQAENVPEAEQFAHADLDAAREALGGRPLTVRIGYHGPNTRLAAVIGAITASCEQAGITVTEVASEEIGPQSLREGQIDALLASTGGSTGSGSSGSSAVDAYELFSGNGNNLSGYRNDQIDGVVSALAVTADPAEMVRLLAEAAPVLWADMPTLPLYRQQRTLMSSKKTYGVAANPTRWGAGWNMDRWALQQ